MLSKVKDFIEWFIFNITKIWQEYLSQTEYIFLPLFVIILVYNITISIIKRTIIFLMNFPNPDYED